MEKILRKGHYGIISQLHSIQEVETPSYILNSNLSYPNTKIYFTPPRDFTLHEVSMIIPFL
jgi:hypothetical protein